MWIMSALGCTAYLDHSKIGVCVRVRVRVTLGLGCVYCIMQLATGAQPAG